MMKRLLIIMISAVITCSVAMLSGCQNDKYQIDPTKTQIYVGIYNGGVGTEWFERMSRRFELENSHIEFEPGKKGVEIVPEANKSWMEGAGLLGNISSVEQEVFITESANYSAYVSNDKLLDITEWLNSDLTEFGENQSILDKIYTDESGYLLTDEKYYAVPFTFMPKGIVYDVKLFRENGLYFAPDGSFIGSSTATRSAGPNGKYGDYDDGLPATYAQFFELCDRMKNFCIPLIWTGQYREQYTRYLYWALYADYEGASGYSANLNFNDTVNDIVTGFDGSGEPILKTVKIGKNNGYELRQQAGRYYALKFFEELIQKKYYSEAACFGSTTSHTGAQKLFIAGNKLPETGKKSVGMLIEGAWWENEASQPNGPFASAVTSYGSSYSKENKEYALMPLPKATAEQVGTDKNPSYPTLVSDAASYVFVKKNIPEQKVDLIRKFVRFMNTDSELQNFTTCTNIPRRLKYHLTAEQKGSLTAFGKSVIEMCELPGTILNAVSGESLYKYNRTTLGYEVSWESGRDTSVIEAFHRSPPVSAVDYFNGLKMTSAKWAELYGAYLE